MVFGKFINNYVFFLSNFFSLFKRKLFFLIFLVNYFILGENKIRFFVL